MPSKSLIRAARAAHEIRTGRFGVDAGSCTVNVAAVRDYVERKVHEIFNPDLTGRARPRRRARLDHFEGRSFVGWPRHVVLTAMAYTWLQDARRRASARLATLPVARAVITEILTAHLFVTRPHYLQTM